jgi:alanine-glyoxylate transaminase/serine-glyoxylate transaminase/serine-pyruvate transaminase
MSDYPSPDRMKTPRLLIPGPVPLEGRVAEELAKPASPHYGKEWVATYRETQDLLRTLFRMRDAKVFPMAGPAHVGMEALVTTLLGPEDKALVIDNGFFGRRLREMLDAHQVEAFSIHGRWGSPPDLRRVEEVLSGTYIRAVFAVHSETSTGMVNPIRELGDLTHDYGSLFVVDAVSSLAGLPLPCDDWKVDAAFAASQKCLGGPPGIAPVVIRPSILDAIDPDRVRGWYTNLCTWDRFSEEWGEWHPQPTTISSNVFRAFKVALELVFEEGLERRLERHRTVGRAYREALRALGFTMVPREEDASDTVTAARPPENIEAPKLQEGLREKFGIVVSGGLTELTGQILRIGHMGPTATPEDLLSVTEALGSLMKGSGAGNAEKAVEVATSLTKGLTD